MITSPVTAIIGSLTPIGPRLIESGSTDRDEDGIGEHGQRRHHEGWKRPSMRGIRGQCQRRDAEHDEHRPRHPRGGHHGDDEQEGRADHLDGTRIGLAQRDGHP